MFAVTTASWLSMKFIYKYMREEFNAGDSNLQFWENFLYYFGIISSQGKTHQLFFPLMTDF